MEIAVTIALAVLAGIGFLAYNHPQEYAKVSWWLVAGSVALPIAFGCGWTGAMLSFALPASTPLECDAIFSRAKKDYFIPSIVWVYWLGSIVYLYFLAVMPNYSLTRDQKRQQKEP